MPVFLLVAFTVNFARKSLSCAMEMVIGFSKLQESTETSQDCKELNYSFPPPPSPPGPKKKLIFGEL